MTRQFTRGRAWAAAAVGLSVGLAAVGATSCDKMPLSAPTESTITLFANSTSVGLNGSVEITATVIESAGTPVQNGTVVNFVTTLGTVEPNEARTNSGKATVRLLAGTRSGTAEVRAFSGGISSGEALQITVGAAAAGKVELLADPSALPAAGGVVQLTAIVSDASGNRLAGVPVSFTTDAGVLTMNSVTSDSAGEARTSLSTTGKAKVTASVTGGSGGGSLTATAEIPVRVGPLVTLSVPAANLVPGVASAFTVTVTAGGAAVRAASIDFGDGGSQALTASGSSSVAHAYARSGIFVVTATATDTAGETATATASVSVQAVVVVVSLSVTTTAPSTSAPVAFSATATTNPTGALIERYEWTFGDGSPMRTTTGPSTSHQYSVAGPYTATVRAFTTQGASGIGQVDFVVK
jgi:PKD repeat protein